MLTRKRADERLRRCLEAAFSDRFAYSMFERHALGALTHLGVAERSGLEFLRRRIRNARIPDLYAFEAQVHADLAALGAYEHLAARLTDRAGDWFGVLLPYIERCAGKRKLRVLDYGGGSGELALRVKALGHEVAIADVIDWRKGDARELPFVQVGRQTKFAGEYDLVLVVTVLHHALEVQRAVDLVTSAAPQALVIESVANTHLEFKYAVGIDHVYNRWLAYNPNPIQKVPVPCHFDSDEGWKNNFWLLTGRSAVASEDLGIYMKLNPEHHHLYLFS
jgi:2-polyprenyl-3-methyl-5-hydroxy-6-metoxy-1,4-benzoquinol methylase